MKQFVLTLILIIKIAVVDAQHTPKQWIIGTNVPNNSILDFSSGTLSMQSVLTGVQVPFGLTNGAIGGSDSSLLFYSEGIRIYNSQHQMISNGDSLSPGASTYASIASGNGLNVNQAVVFLPAPGDTNLVYVFHESGDYWGTPCPNLSPGYVPYSFYYSIIDKTQDSIISKNNKIWNDTIGYPILAIKHGNGRDWWIIIPHINQPVFYRFLLTPNGVSGPYTQTIGQGSCDGYWSVKYSTLTNKVVGFKVEQVFPITKYLDVFDFDRCTGLMSNHQLLTINNYVYSPIPGACEISPNGRFLYAGVLDELHQFDLTAPNIQASEIVVDTIDSIDFWVNKFSYCFMQCAPDGKIYSSDWNNFTLSVINNPDSLGVACNPQQGAVTLPNGHNMDLPNIPLFELGPLAGSACDTLTGFEEKLPPDIIQVNIYPNPATDFIYINSNFADAKKILNFTLYDLEGRKLINSIVRAKENIDVRFLKAGIYTCRINVNGITTTNKLIIIK